MVLICFYKESDTHGVVVLVSGRDHLVNKSKALGSVLSTEKQHKTNCPTNPRHAFKKVVCDLSASTCVTLANTAFIAERLIALGH